MSEFFEKFFSTRLILSIVVALCAVALFIIFRGVERKLKKHESAATVSGVVFSAVRLIILIVAILWILQINGINVSTVAAGLGIASAIVGLALQNYLQDLIMGIRFLSDTFFAVGDCVEYGSAEYEVTAFNLQSTRLKDLDNGSVMTVCNRNITEIKKLGDIINLDVPLSYKEDTRRVHTIFRSLADELAGCDGITACEYKGTQSFEESSILYRFDVHCDQKNRPDMRRLALMKIKNTLEKEGIEIPFNQLDVHCDMAK